MPGTEDDNLRQTYPSYGIVAGGGDDLLPADECGLEGDWEHIEKLSTLVSYASQQAGEKLGEARKHFAAALDGQQAQAAETLSQGYSEGLLELNLLASLWSEVAETVATRSPWCRTWGAWTGYLSPTLSYPLMPGTRHGPQVTGTWSGEGFGLQSEVFTTVITTGVEISHQVLLHTGVISDSGGVLSGVYSETLAGLTPDPLVTAGEFWLLRPYAPTMTRIHLPLVMRDAP